MFIISNGERAIVSASNFPSHKGLYLVEYEDKYRPVRFKTREQAQSVLDADFPICKNWKKPLVVEEIAL